MDHKFRRYAEVFVLIAMGLLALTTVCRMAWVVWPEVLRSESAANWASAIGTAAAAGIALWIALRDGSRRHRDEMTRARLAAASSAGQLANATKAVTDYANWLEKYLAGETDLTSSGHSATALVQVGMARSFVYDLAVLPNNCAENISIASDLTAQVMNEVILIWPNSLVNGMEIPIDRDEIGRRCLQKLRMAEPMLRSAVRELQKAGGLHVEM